jgi:Fe-S cluster assembly iron-binding protein IscA
VLALTEAAAAAINALVESSDFAQGGLRVGAAGASTDEGVELTIVDGPAQGDHVVAAHGASVFVDPAIEDALGDSVLDALLDEDGVHFGLVAPDDAGGDPDRGPGGPG